MNQINEAALSGGRRGRGDRGGASARRAARSGGGPGQQLTYIRRRIKVYEVLDEEGIALIEANADRGLEEIGIEFRDDAEALAMWKEAGADVQGERVHFPKGLCRELLKTAPPVFTQHARNPERSVQIGGDATVFAPVYGPPFVRDLDGNRRYATIEDFRNFVKLAYLAPSIHHSGGTVCEPVDVPVNKRHLDMVHAHMTLSDKPFMGSVTAPERAEDTVAMARIPFGEQFVDDNTVVINLINANSPMVFDETMLGAAKVYARANQATIITPFILAGAMSPVTVAGTLTQILPKFCGAAFTQLCRPGAPVLFGTFASSISMQSGAPPSARRSRRWSPMARPSSRGGSACRSVPAARCVLPRFPTPRQPMKAPIRCTRRCWQAPISFSTQPAGSRADWPPATRNSSWTLTSPACSRSWRRASTCRRTGRRWMRSARWPGSHYLGCSHTQANFQTAFYRSSIADNNPTSSGSRKARRPRRSAPTRSRANGSMPTKRPRWMRESPMG